MEKLISLFAQAVFYMQQQGVSWSKWPFGPGITGGWLFAVTKFVFIGFVLALIILFLRWLFGPGGRLRDPELDADTGSEEQESPMQILNRRFAQGEISEQEFEAKKRLIRDD